MDPVSGILILIRTYPRQGSGWLKYEVAYDMLRSSDVQNFKNCQILRCFTRLSVHASGVMESGSSFKMHCAGRTC